MAKTVKKPAPKGKVNAGKKESPQVDGDFVANPLLLEVGKAKLAGVTFGSSVTSNGVSEESEDDAGIMSAGYAPLNEAGHVINAIFNGRKRIFSEKFAKSKAKKVLSYNGEEHLYRDVLVFTDATGKTFSIFLTGILNSLTRALPRDTAIELTYKGTEIITEGTYAGNDQHIFAIRSDAKADKFIEANQYRKGCHNWITNPMEPKVKDTTPKQMADLNNYMEAVRSGDIVVSNAEKIALLGESALQLSHQ